MRPGRWPRSRSSAARRSRCCWSSHRGRVVRLTGDGALAELGSAVDSMARVTAVQRTGADRQAGVPRERRMVFHVGLIAGDVVVEGDDLLGDGVNVAARLEQLCKPGGVAVSGTVYDRLQGRLGFPLRYAGEHRGKSTERPMRVCRVRPDGGSARRPFAARLRELAPGRWGRTLSAVAAVALAALVLLGGVRRLWPGDPPLKEQPSAAVLPFDNLGGDQTTGRLADGSTEDVITDLVRFRDIVVIPATSRSHTRAGWSTCCRSAGA